MWQLNPFVVVVHGAEFVEIEKGNLQRNIERTS
jgi:hypothetical protein